MKTIGKYIIRGLLGKGGMGKVYKVELPVIGKIVALKLLAPNPFLIDLIGADKARELFISEAVNMAKLRHPNIVDILDFDEVDGQFFYSMDYYSNNLGIIIGETYQVESPSRIIKLDRAVHYISQTLEGLACLHHAGMIHRDIKPFNLLTTEQDTVKICDFGLSKLRGERFAGPSGLKVGSAFYAAPEQEENPDQADAPADLYAVGVILYRMLTGKLPMQNPAPPSESNPDLNQDWDRFILKSIDPNPGKRFASAKGMLMALDQLYEAWLDQKEKSCQLMEFVSDAVAVKPRKPICSPSRLRSRPVKINPKRAGKFFDTDSLWRPRCYIQNDFVKQDNGTIFDRATKLIWEQAGSEYPISWHQAHDHIRKLNQEGYGGCKDWRLPTVDELMSLLSETPHGEDFCLEPVFDQHQKWLWSCDRRSFTAAWYVNVDMGFVSWQDFSGYYFVKGVCNEHL